MNMKRKLLAVDATFLHSEKSAGRGMHSACRMKKSASLLALL
jgi:hypothetical protein